MARPGRALHAGVLLVGLALLAIACTGNESARKTFKATATSNGDFIQHSVTVGDLPSAFDVADADADGDLDIAVTNDLSHTVELLTNDGSLNFTSTTFAVPGEPTKVIFGDFDGGGPAQLDLAVYLLDVHKLALILNDGTAWRQQTIDLPETAHSIAAVDLNGDGSAKDIVLTRPSSGNVDALVNSGNGTFTTYSTPLPGCGASAFLPGDFNGDGKLDLAVLCWVDGTVRILLGDGSGGFSQPQPGGIAVGATPNDIVSADFNNDGKADLAVVSKAAATVSILLGDGAGGFTLSQTISVPGAPEWLATDKFTGANASLAVTHDSLEIVTEMLGNGAGEFALADLGVSKDPYAVVTGDFTGSGARDLFTLERTDRVASVFAGDGSGGFSRTVIGFDELPTLPRRVNFGGSGKDDVVMLQPSLDSVLILENRN